MPKSIEYEESPGHRIDDYRVHWLHRQEDINVNMVDEKCAKNDYRSKNLIDVVRVRDTR